MSRSMPWLAAVLLVAASASAQAPPAAGAGDPGALAALDRMGAYLRSLSVFQVRAETSSEDVLEDGQKVTTGGTSHLLVARPDRLLAEVSDDRQSRVYFYDGKAFTLWARDVNAYATVPAPPSLGELLDRLATEYVIDVPLSDLFFWGTPRGGTGKVRSAIDLGPADVSGISCEHYAFRQEGLDWQVWIQLGDFPLPRKLVLTTRTDEARPQFTSVLSWDLAPSFNDAAFAFAAPAGAERIQLQTAAALASR